MKRAIIEMPVIDMRISRSYAMLRAWEDGNNAEEAKNGAFRSCRRKISSRHSIQSSLTRVQSNFQRG